MRRKLGPRCATVLLLVLVPAFFSNNLRASAPGSGVSRDLLAESWAKVIPWLYPDPAWEGDALEFTLRVVEGSFLPKNVELPPLRVRMSPAGDRIRMAGEYEGRTYAAGRFGNRLWVHDPGRNFAVLGDPEAPLFPGLSDLHRPETLPRFQLPVRQEQAVILPFAFQRASLGQETIGGERATGFRLEPFPFARSVLQLPALTVDYWVRESDQFPARIAYHDGEGQRYEFEFSNISLVTDVPFLGAPPGATRDYLHTVALHHLVRLGQNLFNASSEADLPVLPIARGQIEHIADAEGGRLELHDGVRVLYVGGTPEQMGRQHGLLLKHEINRVVDRLVYGVGVGSSFQKGRWFFDEIEEAQRRAEPFVGERHLREMNALGVAAGLDPVEARVANYFPELFHCSGFALFGKATADGRLYHGRILDYLRGVGLEENAVVMVVRPDVGHAWVNLGYAGFIGSVTAMNEHGVAIGEMGGSSPGNWDGMPMAQLVRVVMEQATTVEEAVELMKKTPRTCEYYYVISDGKTNRAVGVRATSDSFETVWAGETHRLLPESVPDAVLMSAGDRYTALVERVRAQYGAFDSGSAWQLMDLPVAMNSNIQTVLFRPETLDFWVANAGPSTIATQSRSTRFNLAELLKRGPWSP